MTIDSLCQYCRLLLAEAQAVLHAEMQVVLQAIVIADVFGQQSFPFSTRVVMKIPNTLSSRQKCADEICHLPATLS